MKMFEQLWALESIHLPMGPLGPGAPGLPGRPIPLGPGGPCSPAVSSDNRSERHGEQIRRKKLLHMQCIV